MAFVSAEVWTGFTIALLGLTMGACGSGRQPDGVVRIISEPAATPSPGQFQAYVSRLPACGMAVVPGASWEAASLAVVPGAELRLPPGFEAEQGSGLSAWRRSSPDPTRIAVSASDSASLGLAGSEEGETADQQVCRLAVASRPAAVYLFRRVERGESVFAATLSLMVSADVSISALVTSSTERGRSEALAALSTLVLPES